MRFSLFGETVEIDLPRENYNKYRLMFEEEARQAVKRFQKLYQSNSTLEMVVKNVPDQMYQSAAPAVDRCIQVLIDHGVLTIDAERFTNMYSDIWEAAANAHMKIQDQYAEIVLDEEQKDAYRKARREGRGRWQGGGFGIKGAVKGAATAGAFNALAGAGHALFNGFAKLGSSIAAKSKMNKIYQSKDTLNTLSDGLFETVWMFHLALIDCLDKTGADHETVGGIVTLEDQETVSAILSNIPQISDYEQRRNAMIRAFQLDPYQKNWYRLALQFFGDQDGSLEKVEQYFGISVIRREKERQLDELARSLPLNTEEQAQQAAKKIEVAKADLCYSGETEQTRAILAAVDKFDSEYRTVDGMILSTRQEADTARRELSAILGIEKEIDYDDLTSIAEGEEKIRDYTSPVAKAHQDKLHQQWTELDTRLRSVSTLLPDNKKISCKTIQQAEQLRPLVQDLKQRLDACGDGPEAEPPLLQLKTNLETEPLPSVLKRCYTEEIDNRLASIDRILRTTLGKEYPTREAAREAERQYQQIRSDFSTGNPRKSGSAFRERIEAMDLSDETRTQLLDELFQLENAREIKAAKAFSSISAAILLGIVIVSYFFHLSGTAEFARKDVVVKGVSLMVTDVQVTDELTFLDGLKNGLVVFGRSFGDIFVNGFFEYIDGFDYGWIGNVLWAFLGLFWVLIEQFLIGIARYFVSLVVTAAQTAPIPYYIGYVIGSGIPIAVSQLSFDEDKQEENVRRIKGWSTKKIGLVIAVILLAAAITGYFVYQELPQNRSSVDDTRISTASNEIDLPPQEQISGPGPEVSNQTDTSDTANIPTTIVPTAIDYSEAAAWAEEEGVILGLTEDLSLDTLCGEDDMALFLWNYCVRPHIQDTSLPVEEYAGTALDWGRTVGMRIGVDSPCTLEKAARYIRTAAEQPLSGEGSSGKIDADSSDVDWAITSGIVDDATRDTVSPEDVITCGDALQLLYHCSQSSVTFPEDTQWLEWYNQAHPIYEPVNGVYYNELYWGCIELINAYAVDSAQYYDRFVYESIDEIKDKDRLQYGFTSEDIQVSCPQSQPIGGEHFMCESTGPIDEQGALALLKQLHENNPDRNKLQIILDPNQYLEETLLRPGDIIVSKEYINESTGLNTAEVVHRGTMGYQDALNRVQE